MSSLKELYQEVILDHNRAPRNFRVLADANREAEGYNPLCGDRVTVYLKIDDGGVIRDIGFQGSGCAIDRAAASMMTASVKGKRADEVERLFAHYHRMLTGGGEGPATSTALGKLSIFAGVSEFPARVKCATLPWHTLRAALAGSSEKVSTE